MAEPDVVQEPSEKITIKGLSPITVIYGFVPYIIMSLFSAPGSFVLVTTISFVMSAGWMVFGLFQRRGLHQLSTVGTVLFGAMLVLAFADPGLDTWLRNWSGTLSEIALVLTAFIGIAVKKPFTLYYAKMSVDPVQWEHNSDFRAGVVKVSQTITAVWGLSFLVGVVCDVLPNGLSDTFMFAWVVPLIAMFGAIRFTFWYPEYRQKKTFAEHPEIVAQHRAIAEQAGAEAAGVADDSQRGTSDPTG